MNFIKNEIKDSKISIFCNHMQIPYKIIVYNIGLVINFDEHEISFEKFKIIGDNLKISLMEGDEVEIKGKIKGISYSE